MTRLRWPHCRRRWRDWPSGACTAPSRTRSTRSSTRPVRVQHALCNAQHATCNTQRATRSVQRATRSVQRATRSVQRAAGTRPKAADAHASQPTLQPSGRSRLQRLRMTRASQPQRARLSSGSSPSRSSRIKPAIVLAPRAALRRCSHHRTPRPLTRRPPPAWNGIPRSMVVPCRSLCPSTSSSFRRSGPVLPPRPPRQRPRRRAQSPCGPVPWARPKGGSTLRPSADRRRLLRWRTGHRPACCRARRARLRIRRQRSAGRGESCCSCGLGVLDGRGEGSCWWPGSRRRLLPSLDTLYWLLPSLVTLYLTRASTPA